jgi:hypothetical protein
MKKVTGGTLPASIWKETMTTAIKVAEKRGTLKPMFSYSMIRGGNSAPSYGNAATQFGLNEQVMQEYQDDPEESLPPEAEEQGNIEGLLGRLLSTPATPAAYPEQ